MTMGEDALRSRRYRDAISSFSELRLFAPQAPEPLLNLAHACLGIGNYWSMAGYVRQALAEYPQLVQQRIELRAFFANSTEFVGLRESLRQAASATLADSAAASGPAGDRRTAAHVDASTLFAMVYVEWFDGNVDDARKFLIEAARASTDPFLSEAIETFWQGMVQSGRASGCLIEQAGLVTASPQIAAGAAHV